uniref:Putative u3 small nucleolar rna-associated protein 4 n=1 Tax=Anopheles triannulatus TaxID=58253 RepID=A0A2M4AAQ6_9DIPT
MITPKPATDSCRLHNVQFYNLLPRAIVCTAMNRQTNRLALARDDGTIEIWNLVHARFLEKTIPGGAGVSIEGLAWAENDRLFSVSLAGTLVEWDLRPGSQSRVKQSILVTGNAAWCIDVSRDGRRLAVGTEGGYINLYRLENDELSYERILDKQDGRVLCCRFDASGDFLVTGSADAVRVWDVRNGHAVHKMTTGRTDYRVATQVWDVWVMKDFTIISVDSRGRLMFCDGQLGTVLESVPVSKGDLLCIAMEEDERTLYVAGIESNISTFRRSQGNQHGGRRNQFIRTAVRRPHTHDIRTMVTFGRNSLVSGGVDGMLVVTSFPPFQTDKYLPLLPSPCTVVAADSRLVLLKYVNYLEVWTLAQRIADGMDGLDCAGAGRKVMQIRSKDDEHIICASISPNGRWLLYSTESTLRLLRSSCENEKLKLKRVRLTVPDTERTASCYRADFTHDSMILFLYHGNGAINVYAACCTASPGRVENVEEGIRFEHQHTIDGSRWFSDQVHLSAVSQCNRYLVCADRSSSIVVFERTVTPTISLISGTWKRSISLPRYMHPPTAIAIQPGKTRLAVAFADHKLFLYDFEEFQFIFSIYLTLSEPDCGSPNHPISGIVFDPRHEASMLLKNNCDILALRFGVDAQQQHEDQSLECSAPQKVRKTSGGNDDDGDMTNGKTGQHDEATVKTTASKQTKHTLKLVRKSNHLVGIEWLGENELVAIEANGLSMVEHLPGAFRKKFYGKA